MTDHIESLALEQLRAIRADMGSLKDDVWEIKSRVNTLEAGQGNANSANRTSCRHGCRTTRSIR